MSAVNCPVVSGVSPKEGLPGTKITIRGENLGNSKEDVECKPFAAVLFFFCCQSSASY